MPNIITTAEKADVFANGYAFIREDCHRDVKSLTF